MRSPLLSLYSAQRIRSLPKSFFAIVFLTPVAATNVPKLSNGSNPDPQIHVKDSASGKTMKTPIITGTTTPMVRSRFLALLDLESASFLTQSTLPLRFTCNSGRKNSDGSFQTAIRRSSFRCSLQLAFSRRHW